MATAAKYPDLVYKICLFHFVGAKILFVAPWITKYLTPTNTTKCNVSLDRLVNTGMKTLKKLLISGIAGIGLYCIQSCCKVYCVKEELPLRFINFDSDELDSVLLIRYKGNNQFDIKLDSFYEPMPRYAPGAVLPDTLTGSVYEKDVDSDWEIKVVSVNRSYKINDIKYHKQSCPCGPGQSKRVTNFKLNGLEHDSEYIDLVK
jgi:hypothetical protein